MADELSKVFAALADPTRRDIVARLAVGDATVSELAAPYDVSAEERYQRLDAVLARPDEIPEQQPAQENAS